VLIGSLIDVDVNGWDGYMRLDGRVGAVEINGLLEAGHGIDRSAQDVAFGIAVDVASGLVQFDKLRLALEIIEKENAVRFGNAKARSDLGQLSFLKLTFFLEFFIELHGFRRSRRTIFFEFVGRGPIDQRVGKFFPFLAFRAVVANAVPFDFVFCNELVGTIFQDEAMGRVLVLGGRAASRESYDNEEQESAGRRHSGFIIPLVDGARR